MAVAGVKQDRSGPAEFDVAAERDRAAAVEQCRLAEDRRSAHPLARRQRPVLQDSRALHQLAEQGAGAQHNATSSPSPTCRRSARGIEKSRKMRALRPTMLATRRPPTCNRLASASTVERSSSAPSIRTRSAIEVCGPMYESLMCASAPITTGPTITLELTFAVGWMSICLL